MVMGRDRIDSAQFGPVSFVVSVVGDVVDRHEALEAQLSPLLGIGGARIVLDVAGAYGMDARTVAVVTTAARTLAEAGERQLVVVGNDTWFMRELSKPGVEPTHLESTLTKGLAHAAA